MNIFNVLKNVYRQVEKQVTNVYHTVRHRFEEPLVFLDHSRDIANPKRLRAGSVFYNKGGEAIFRNVGIEVSQAQQRRHILAAIALNDSEKPLRDKLYDRFDEQHNNRILKIVSISVRFNKIKGSVKESNFDSNGHESISTQYDISQRKQIPSITSRIIADLKTKLEEFETTNGSGWIFYSLINIVLNTTSLPVSRGSTHITVAGIQKRGVLNIKNTDNRCLLYCLAASSHPELYNKKSGATKPEQYEKYFKDIILPPGIEDELNLGGVDPKSTWIDKLEELNNLRICIYGPKCKKPRKSDPDLDPNLPSHYRVIPIDPTENRNRRLVNLVYLTNLKGENHHYALIKEICSDGKPGFIKFSQGIQNDHSKYTQACPFCYLTFQPPHHSKKKGHTDEIIDKLTLHIKNGCRKHKNTVPLLHSKGATIEFDHPEALALFPYVGYLDHEADSNLIYETNGEKTFEHKPSQFIVVFIDTLQPDPSKKIIKTICHRGSDAISKGLLATRKYCDVLVNKIKKTDYGFKLTPEHQEQLSKATECWICHRPLFVNKSYEEEQLLLKNDPYAYSKYRREETSHIAVIDHDHLSGYIYGVAHSYCNVRRSNRHIKIPIIGHNMIGYDNHPVVLELSNQIVNERLTIQESSTHQKPKLEVVAKTNEKYMSMSIGNMKIIDSVLHLNFSLAEMIKQSSGKDKQNINEAFPIFKAYLTSINKADTLSTLCGKIPLPYNYSAPDMYTRTEFFPKEAFENYLLKGKKYQIGDYHSTGPYEQVDGMISDGDYAKGEDIFYNKLHCKNTGEYYDLYCMADVLQLADIFETYRKAAFSEYEIDPVKFISNPSFAYQALLKTTKQKVVLPHDIDMYNFITSNIRGGLSLARKKRIRQNTKCLFADYNSMYWGVQSGYMPTGEMWWEEKLPSDLDEWMKHVISYPKESSTGFFPEVDLYCPEELYSKFYKFALAPTKEIITPDRLTDYQRRIKDECHITTSSSEKLTITLHPKIKYGLDYQELQYYLKMGYKVSKVHRILHYTQDPWMRPFVEKNLNNRKKYTLQNKPFLSTVYKTTGHSGSFGKFIEKTLEHNNSVMVCSDQVDDRMMQNMSGNLKDYAIFPNNHLAIRHNFRDSAYIERNPLVGAVILSRAKVPLYAAFYTLLERFPNLELCYCDTDSLLMDGLPDNYKSIIKNDPNLYDMFDFSSNTDELYSDKNFMVLSKLKDETKGREITDGIFLCSKSYSIEYDHGKEYKKASKGIKKDVIIENLLKHQDYIDVYENSSFQKVQANFIKAENHINYTIPITKVGLCAYDDKQLCPSRDLAVPYGTPQWLIDKLN